MLFFCYRNANIRYTKCPISTRPVKKKKKTLAWYACLCFHLKARKFKIN